MDLIWGGDHVGDLKMSTAHHHLDQPIDRWSVSYWITGDGQWAPRWDCSSHDWLLAAVTISTIIFMAWEYGVYAHKCDKMFKLLPEGASKSHVMYLRKVFLQCLSIHVVMNVVAWVVTPYYLLSLLVLYNAFQTRKLNHSKTLILHIQEIENHNLVVANTRAALTTLDDGELTLTEKLDQAKTALLRTVGVV